MRLRWRQDSRPWTSIDTNRWSGIIGLAMLKQPTRLQPIPLRFDRDCPLSNRRLQGLVEVLTEVWLALGAGGDIQFGRKSEINGPPYRPNEVASPPRLIDSAVRWFGVGKDNGWRNGGVDDAVGDPRWQLPCRTRRGVLKTVRVSP